MSTCNKCNFKNAADALFCVECGNKLAPVVPKQQDPVVPQPQSETVTRVMPQAQEPTLPPPPAEKCFCRNCSNEVQKGAYACLQCGLPPTKGKKYCPTCAAPTHEEAVICVKCGINLAKSALPSLGNLSQTVGNLSSVASSNLQTAQQSGNALPIGAAAVLLLAFFMTWFSVAIFSASGYEIVFGQFGAELGAGRFAFLLGPICAILVLVKKLTGKVDGISMNAVKFIPIISLILGVIIVVSKLSSMGSNSSGSGDIFSYMSFGFILTLLSAIALCFSKEQN